MANHLSHFHHHHLLLLLLLVPHANAEKCKVDSYEGKVRVFGTQGSVACLCEGGEARSYFDFTSPAGLSVSCRVGEACTPGMDQTQTSNATDASCGPLARCTDDTSTPYKGCIPSKCTIDRSTPYQGCPLAVTRTRLFPTIFLALALVPSKLLRAKAASIAGRTLKIPIPTDTRRARHRASTTETDTKTSRSACVSALRTSPSLISAALG